MPIIIDQDGKREVSEQEYNNYLIELHSIWNKEAHISDINLLHDKLFFSLIKDYNYSGGLAELMLWSQLPETEYYIEATKLKQWYIDTYKIILDYKTEVNETNFIQPEIFIENLPAFIP